MANKESLHFNPAPGKVPSPEELFHDEKNYEKESQEKSVSSIRQKPIPHYRIVKHFAYGFLIVLILLVIAMLNLDKVGIHFYYMTASSMESSIPKGSLLVEHLTKADKLTTGDVITYTNGAGESSTHEIVQVVPLYSNDEPAFLTKEAENVDRNQEIVEYANVKGKVIFHVPYIGSFFMKIKGK